MGWDEDLPVVDCSPVLVTVRELVGEHGFTAGEVWQWRSRGYIAPVEWRGRVSVYRLEDVRRCKTASELRARRFVPCGPRHRDRKPLDLRMAT